LPRHRGFGGDIMVVPGVGAQLFLLLQINAYFEGPLGTEDLKLGRPIAGGNGGGKARQVTHGLPRNCQDKVARLKSAFIGR
jgi:hypothetical protein